MNVNTGHLIAIQEGQVIPEGYIQVPTELQAAANRKLNGAREAMVSLGSGGKLSRWARGQRKTKRKMSKESRRRNRHG